MQMTTLSDHVRKYIDIGRNADPISINNSKYDFGGYGVFNIISTFV